MTPHSRENICSGWRRRHHCCAGLALLRWQRLWPLQTMDAVQSSDRDDVRITTMRTDQTPPLAGFAAAWGRNLRQSLADVPNSAPAAAETAISNLPVRLVGTIVDTARPRGIFMTQLGQMELRGVGEKTGGAEILRIEERSATLSIAGQSVTLKVEKMEQSIPAALPVLFHRRQRGIRTRASFPENGKHFVDHLRGAGCVAHRRDCARRGVDDRRSVRRPTPGTISGRRRLPKP